MTDASGGGGPPAGAPFPREVLAGPTLAAARALIGARLVRGPGPGGVVRVGRIVEVEAYIGEEDRASHARMGPTPRNRVMFGPPGLAYVYLVYGMHHCLNVVTEPPNRPAAVLIRAVEPVSGAAPMRSRRERGRRAHVRVPDARLAAGPGLVAAAFDLDRGHTGLDLCDPASPVRLEAAPQGDPAPAVEATPRVGIAYAGEPRTTVPWRFIDPASPSLSGRPRRPDGRPEHGCPVARPARVSRGPRASRGEEVLRALRAAGRGNCSRPTDPVLVVRGLDETDQARQCPGGPGVASARLTTSSRGSGGRRVADASSRSQFLEIADTLDATARLATSLADERRPLLRDVARRLHPLPALRSTLARSFDPVGELLDTASPRLGPLRAAVRVAYDGCDGGWTRWVGSELGGALQEPLVTMRNGRYVVPIRAEARNRVKGIVHDASGSGQTLFVEPLVIVELGNAWREAQAAVDEEEGRILDELSALTAANAGPLTETLEALAQFDFWAAKAQLAAEMDGVRPSSPTAGRGPPVRAPPRPVRARRADRHPAGDGYTRS